MPQQSSKTLASLLAAEDQRRREFARKANTRHSRFGTTIAVTVKPGKAKPGQPDNGGGAEPGPSSRSYVLHRQAALTTDSGAALDMARAKKHKAPKGKKVDELGREDNLTIDARVILQNFARSFIENCFNRTSPITFLSVLFPPACMYAYSDARLHDSSTFLAPLGY